MTPDLVTWLRAQLDEDERVARAMDEVDWSVTVASDLEWNVEPGLPGKAYLAVKPSRVLAEVAAKRRILDLWQMTYEAQAYAFRQGILRSDPKSHTQVLTGLSLAIQALAQPYAGRSGWRSEWAALPPAADNQG